MFTHAQIDRPARSPKQHPTPTSVGPSAHGCSHSRWRDFAPTGHASECSECRNTAVLQRHRLGHQLPRWNRPNTDHQCCCRERRRPRTQCGTVLAQWPTDRAPRPKRTAGDPHSGRRFRPSGRGRKRSVRTIDWGEQPEPILVSGGRPGRVLHRPKLPLGTLDLARRRILRRHYSHHRESRRLLSLRRHRRGLVIHRFPNCVLLCTSKSARTRRGHSAQWPGRRGLEFRRLVAIVLSRRFDDCVHQSDHRDDRIARPGRW